MKYFELIDAFLSGDLSQAEEAAFLEAMRTDEALRQEVELHREMDTALTETDALTLRATLQRIHTRLADQPADDKIRKWRFTWAYQAAAVLLLLIVSAGIYYYVQDDTMSSEQLYSMYYQPDDAVMIMRAGASGTHDGQLMEALKKYEAQDYQGALQLFKQGESNLLVHFYSGLAYMEINNYEEAINSFQKIMDEGENLFVEQASWYQGLCYLKTGQNEKVLETLRQLAQEGNPYEQRAEFIMQKLKR